MVGDDKDEGEAPLPLWEGPEDVGRGILERQLRRKERERMRLVLNEGNPIIRTLRALSHRVHDAGRHLCPVGHLAYTIVQTGLSSVGRKRTVVG